MPPVPSPRRAAAGALLTVLLTPLAGCGSGDDAASSAGSAASSAVSSAASSMGSAASTVRPTITEAWAKAVETTTGKHPMTGVFGVIHNPGPAPLRISGGSSPAAGMVELHETVKDGNGQMTMRPVKGGFTVPAGGTLVLRPGGNHIMLMMLTAPVRAGTSVTVTLQTSAGELKVTAPARTFTGGQESYAPSASSS